MRALGHFNECSRCISASCEHYGRCRYSELMAWRAQAIEAQRAETAKQGSVHESAVPEGKAP
jgi:hypothetical protein